MLGTPHDLGKVHESNELAIGFNLQLLKCQWRTALVETSKLTRALPATYRSCGYVLADPTYLLRNLV